MVIGRSVRIPNLSLAPFIADKYATNLCDIWRRNAEGDWNQIAGSVRCVVSTGRFGRFDSVNRISDAEFQIFHVVIVNDMYRPVTGDQITVNLDDDEQWHDLVVTQTKTHSKTMCHLVCVGVTIGQPFTLVEVMRWDDGTDTEIDIGSFNARVQFKLSGDAGFRSESTDGSRKIGIALFEPDSNVEVGDHLGGIEGAYGATVESILFLPRQVIEATFAANVGVS